VENQSVKFFTEDLAAVKQSLNIVVESFHLDDFEEWTIINLKQAFEYAVLFKEELKLSEQDMYLVKMLLHIFVLENFEPAMVAELKNAFFANLKMEPTKLNFLKKALLLIEQNKEEKQTSLAVAADIKHRQKLRKKYFEHQTMLYKEDILSGEEGSNMDKLTLIENFYHNMNSYSFKTKIAKKLWKKKKISALRIMSQFIEKSKRENSLLFNKIAMTMIKTSSRNQIDLINIADKRAGIMITVNAILLTLMIPLFASYIFDVSSFIIPMLILIISSGITIVLATLATKPLNRKSPEMYDLIKGNRSIFYFDNFKDLNKGQFTKTVNDLVVKSSYLENAIYADLYDTGIKLSLKFKRLRWCYSIFAIGIISTIISFVFCILYFDI